MTKHTVTPQFTGKAFSLWVGLTVLGYLVGADFHYNPEALVRPFSARDLSVFGAVVGFFMSAVAGLLVALFQWNILKAWAPATRFWIPANTVAFGLVHALNDSWPYLPLPFPWILAIGGLIVGVAQAMALRRVLSRAIVWVPLAAGTWVVAFQSLFALQSLVAGDPLAGVILGHGIAGLITGVITGAALKLLMVDKAVDTERLVQPPIASH